MTKRGLATARKCSLQKSVRWRVRRSRFTSKKCFQNGYVGFVNSLVLVFFENYAGDKGAPIN